MSHTHPRGDDNGIYRYHYKEFLSHKDEPREEGVYNGALAELDAELLRSSYFEKRKFRRMARRLRHYAT